MPPTSEHLLPPPFAWIPIPAGDVTLRAGGYLSQATTFDVLAFEIAKYPLTNAQFEKFVKAEGYTQQQWWIAGGWQVRARGGWREPRYWRESKRNKPDHPVAGVSWYEAMAFCQWLSDVTGEHIMLPTEQQWQRAAQGDDNRAYPWGNTFDACRCNSSVESESTGTTPVTHFEGKGDSPFGVVDMIGNVWEWCLTDCETGAQDIHRPAQWRALRGGSCWSIGENGLRAAARFWNRSDFGYSFGGFRLARSL